MHMFHLIKPLLAILLFLPLLVSAQFRSASDGDGSALFASLRNTPEAEAMLRVGDIDNLGFGFEEGFNPFCERSTYGHGYPWEAPAADVPGMDRILLPSSYRGGSGPCGNDGYSDALSPATRPLPFEIPLASIRGIAIRSAVLQIMADDFQAPLLCSRFQIWLNDKRFAEGERLLNALQQTGPVGKVVSMPLPPEMIELLSAERLVIRIDDPVTGAGDGFAIDFIKLLINPKPSGCRGQALGRVLVRDTDQPIAGASVELRGYGQVQTGADGSFRFERMPAGLHPLDAFAPGYNRGAAVADVWEGGEEEILIYLDPADKSASYGGRTLREGESLAIENIQFDQGSASLRPDARAELDKIFAFLQENPSAEIELSGHTSSEGEDAANKSLSLKRVLSCKSYLAGKGIDEARVLTLGYGEERPLASNDSEAGRARNRRVEMRILKL
jgi:outer membrane protein OmpA-like peptidoglycan-associated protein